MLVLIAGAPGGPRDWLAAGRLVDVMDRFAAAHRGIAPVVVVPDATGERFATGRPAPSSSGPTKARTCLARSGSQWSRPPPGMRIRYLVPPGGHSGTVATAGLQLALPEIADRAGIPASTSG